MRQAGLDNNYFVRFIACRNHINVFSTPYAKVQNIYFTSQNNG